MCPIIYLLTLTVLTVIENSEGSSCEINHVRCDNKCIRLQWVCDGGDDCDYGIDEKGCPNKILTLRNIYKSNIREHSLTTLSRFKEQRTPFGGWGRNTNKVVVALRLSDPGFFNRNMITDEVIARDLQSELLATLRSREDDSVSIAEMAQYSHALLAVCMNPKDFFGFNIIQKMETELNSTMPLNSFVALALCNANGSLPHSRIMELINILKNERSGLELIAQQAYALMTLNCLHKKCKADLDLAINEQKLNDSRTSSYDSIKNSTANILKSLQQDEGNFGDVYTTSLVIQALLSSEICNINLSNLSRALDYIFLKALNASFQDITSAYLLLPVLNGKTLLDLGMINCSSLLLEDKTERCVHNKRIWYSIWIGNEHVYDMAMSVSVNSTFFDVMVLAADVHKKYRFEYVQFPGGKYLTSLSDIKNDAEARKYWYLFHLEDNKPTVSYIYPDTVIPKHEEKFVYWYRSTILEDKEEL